MPQQLLDRPDVAALMKQVGGKAVAKCMTTSVLRNARLSHRPFNCFLKKTSGGVEPVDHFRSAVRTADSRGKDVLPRPLTHGVGVFTGERLWQINKPEAVIEVRRRSSICT